MFLFIFYSIFTPALAISVRQVWVSFSTRLHPGGRACGRRQAPPVRHIVVRRAGLGERARRIRHNDAQMAGGPLLCESWCAKQQSGNNRNYMFINNIITAPSCRYLPLRRALRSPRRDLY